MNFVKMIVNQLDALVQLVYPPLCICCEGIVEVQTLMGWVCPECLESLQPVPQNYVHTEILQRLNPNFLNELHAVFQFNSTIQLIIHRVKYQKGQNSAFRLGYYSREKMDEKIPWKEADLVIPVPLYGGREKERGFNQSLMIAEGLFSNGSPVIDSSLLVREKPTQSQTEMGREERKTNVSKAFKILQPAKVCRKRIILVDDVVTTGATLNECAAELKKAGAEAVYGLTIATPVLVERAE